MTRAAVLVLAACGRLGFDPQASPDAVDAVPDVLVARPDVVQVGTETAASTDSITVDLVPTGAGGLIVVATLTYVVGGTAEPVVAVTDDAQNTYVSAGARAAWNGDDGAVEIWYAANARPGASVVRIGSPNLMSRVAWVLEIANMQPATPLESAGTIDDRPTVSDMPAAPLVSASGGGVLVSLLMVNGTITQVTAGSPFVLLPVLNGDGVAYAIVDAPGSYGAVVDAPGSGNYAAVTAAFRGLAAP